MDVITIVASIESILHTAPLTRSCLLVETNLRARPLPYVCVECAAAGLSIREYSVDKESVMALAESS